MFTSNYNPYTTKSKPCYGIPRIFAQPVLMYLYLFLPPLPHISYHSPQPLLAIVNNALCGHKTQMRKISFFSTWTKTGLEENLQRKSIKSAFAEKKSLYYIFPYENPGGLDGPMLGQPEENC